MYSVKMYRLGENMVKLGNTKAIYQRLPIYLNYLNAILKDGQESISATKLATALSLGEVQVRKDLCLISGAGKPKVGYNTFELVSHLKNYLGLQEEINAVLVGAGKLGNALLGYEGFKDYNIKLLAGFDVNPSNAEKRETNVYPISRLCEFCLENDVKIGIITVPTLYAQEVCDKLLSCNIKAIWNFAPVLLKCPESVLVKNENMASSLAMLSVELKNRYDK